MYSYRVHSFCFILVRENIYLLSLVLIQKDYQLSSIDNRTIYEKERDRFVAERVTKRNLEALNIRMTEKTRRKYVPGTLIRLNFEEGWYCYVTDNAVKSSKTVITLHGAPGNHVEWAGLEHEMEGYCRWINFIIPGFDGQDERRGTYDSTRSQLFKLIVLVLDSLQVDMAIVCAHSFSSTYAPQLIKAYPHRFQGYINMGGIPNVWSHGFLTMYYNITVSEGYFLMAKNGQFPWNDEQQRMAMYQRFKQRIRQQNLGNIQLVGLLSLYEYFTFLKLTVTMGPTEMDHIFKQSRHMPLLKVLFYGNNDPYTLNELIEMTICQLIRETRPERERILALAGRDIEERLRQQFGVEVEGRKIQEYFCFMFQETGHAVHRRRPSETSKIIKIYIATLEIIDKYLPLIHSSL